MKAINEHFYGAMKGYEAEKLIAAKLLERGFTRHNSLFANSACPDEINHDDPEDDLTLLFFRRWGEIIPLSCLAGLPFVGKSGCKTMFEHVPKHGNIIILFAPHVGIDNDGNVGTIKRNFQSAKTPACGAAIGSLRALQKDETSGDFKNGHFD